MVERHANLHSLHLHYTTLYYTTVNGSSPGISHLYRNTTLIESYRITESAEHSIVNPNLKLRSPKKSHTEPQNQHLPQPCRYVVLLSKDGSFHIFLTGYTTAPHHVAISSSLKLVVCDDMVLIECSEKIPYQQKWLCTLYTNCLIAPGCTWCFPIKTTPTGGVESRSQLLPSIRQGRSTLGHTLNCRHSLISGCAAQVTWQSPSKKDIPVHHESPMESIQNHGPMMAMVFNFHHF